MKKSILQSLKNKGIRISDNTPENLKNFNKKVLTGKLTKDEVNAFLNSSGIALGAVVKSLEAMINSHVYLSSEKTKNISKLIDMAGLLISESMSDEARNKVVDLIKKLAAITERLDKNDKKHQRSLLKIAMVPITMVATAALFIGTRGKVNLTKYLKF